MLLNYIVKRLIHIIPVLFGLSLIAFALGTISPGDPAYFVLSNDSSTEPTEQELNQVREQLGLNDPFFNRYIHWLVRALQGDFGQSYRSGRPVLDELRTRLPVSLNISFFAFLITITGGISIGILAAGYHNGWIDRLCRGLSITLISIPGFWFGIIFIFIFAEVFHLLPSSGYGHFSQLLLPSLVLGTGTLGITIRLTRASLLEAMSQDYILTGHSAGIRKGSILWRHALPNSAIPILTLLGSYLGNIIGGSVIVETLFALPGMGQYAVNGVLNRDFPVVQGYIIVSGVIYVLIHLVLDISYIFLDPRIRIGAKER